MLNTPVLFIVFNRADTTRQVFEAIRKAKPKQLFVAADGPRPDKEGEKEKCDAVRKIATGVDWDCEVKTLFREENKGCGLGPAEAITWFFENVEQGIILEDDCLPDPSFFPFCDELLVKYKNNENVVIISGFNSLERKMKIDEDYFFSKFGGIWGWATWKRAWKEYNFIVPEWNNPVLKQMALEVLEYTHYQNDMINHLDRALVEENIDFWDFQWWFYRLIQNGLCIIPKNSLISNIGFGSDATHTFDKTDQFATIKSKSLKFPLIHPESIIENTYFGMLLAKQNENFGGVTKNFIRKYINKLKHLSKKVLKG